MRKLPRLYADLRSWEHTVLKHTYEDVDYISCHAYYEEFDGVAGSFLSSAVNMDHFIESVLATADSVRAELHHKKRINISFDEWNVWYITRYRNDEQITDVGNWPTAPRILEHRYSVLDGVVGNLLISLLKHADRVTSASNGSARECDRPDHDRARRRRVAADDILSVCGDLEAGGRVSLLVKLESDTYQTDGGQLDGQLTAVNASGFVWRKGDPSPGRPSPWANRPALGSGAANLPTAPSLHPRAPDLLRASVPGFGNPAAGYGTTRVQSLVDPSLTRCDHRGRVASRFVTRARRRR